jgi:hypothetical protein
MDELVSNFSYLSPNRKDSFPLSKLQNLEEMCSNPNKSDNSISEVSNFEAIFEKSRLKSAEVINDFWHSTEKETDSTTESSENS